MSTREHRRAAGGVAGYVDMDWHPAARIPPMMPQGDFDELVESIRTMGLLEPIKLLGGRILDGRHRHRACQVAGVEPRFEYLTTAEIGSPTQYVLARETRRHQTPAQRAAMAVAVKASFAEEAKERQREHGGSAPGKESLPVDSTGSDRREDGEAIVQAARAVKAGVSAAKALDKISRTAPDVVEAVQAGTVKTVEDAKRAAALPAAARADVLHKLARGEASGVRDAAEQLAIPASAYAAIPADPEDEDVPQADLEPLVVEADGPAPREDSPDLTHAGGNLDELALATRFAADAMAFVGAARARLDALRALREPRNVATRDNAITHVALLADELRALLTTDARPALRVIR